MGWVIAVKACLIIGVNDMEAATVVKKLSTADMACVNTIDTALEIAKAWLMAGVRARDAELVTPSKVMFAGVRLKVAALVRLNSTCWKIGVKEMEATNVERKFKVVVTTGVRTIERVDTRPNPMLTNGVRLIDAEVVIPPRACRIVGVKPRAATLVIPPSACWMTGTNAIDVDIELKKLRTADVAGVTLTLAVIISE